MDELGVAAQATLGTNLPESFKDTGPDDLPEGWKTLQLRVAVDDITSGDWGAAEQTGELVAVRALRGTDFARAARGSLQKAPIRYLKESSIQKRQVGLGDALIELSGGSKDQPTGRLLLVSEHLIQQTDRPIVFSNFVKRLRVNQTIFLPEFFGYLWAASYARGRTRIYEKRTTGIRNFKLADFLENEYVAVPPLYEQRSIARALRTVQEAVEATEKVIEATRELKRSLMDHLFTYGPVPVDEADQVPMKETEIGSVPEHWNEVNLGNVARIISGGTPSRKRPDFWNGDIPWVKTGEVSYSVITSTEERITRQGLEHSSARIIPAGTLLVAMYGQGITRGRVAILGLDAAINQACAAILPTREIQSGFLYHYFSYNYENIRNLGHGAHQKNLSATLLKSLPIPSPSLSEQGEIAQSLDAADNKLAVEESRRAALEVLFKTLLHNLMTGKVRVNDLDLPEVEGVV